MDHSLRQRLFGVALAGALFLPLTSCEKPGGSEAPTTSASPSAPEATAPAAPKVAVAANGPEAARFNEVTAQLDPGGFSYAYFSTEKFLSNLSAQLDKVREFTKDSGNSGDESVAKGFDLAKRVIQGSGIEEISGVGSSAISVGSDGLRSKLFIHHESGRDKGVLWALVGPPAHPLVTLDLLPAQTAVAAFVDFDPPLLVKLIGDAIKASGEANAQQSFNQMMASISSATGMPADQALKTLVGPAGLILTLDPAKEVQYPLPTGAINFPAPTLALVLTSKDDHMFSQLEAMIMANPGSTKVDEPGLRIRSMAEMPLNPQLKVTPSVARWGDYLILASDAQLVRDIIAAKGKGLKSTPEFAKVTSGLPDKGNGFYYVSSTYTNATSKMMTQMFENNDALPPAQKSLLSNVFKQMAGVTTYSLSSRLENGWLLTSNQTRVGGAPDFAGLMFTAFMAGAAPGFEAAREKAKTAKASSNARQIAVACTAYASDHGGKFPNTLEELVPTYLPNAAALRSPFNAADPVGYNYTSGLTSSSPADATLLSDRFSEQSNHERVIVHVDGSVQTTKIP